VVSARAAHGLGWDRQLFAAELGLRAPRLVVLAYGTNEADMAVSGRVLEQQLVKLIGRVQRAAPGAAVLVLGPPDLARKRRGGVYEPSPSILTVIEAERRAARRAGAAFFDQRAAVGMSIEDMFAAGLAIRDRCHLTERGYQLAADALADALISAASTPRSAR
jgi:lysophospholipase L1-like esterase